MALSIGFKKEIVSRYAADMDFFVSRNPLLADSAEFRKSVMQTALVVTGESLTTPEARCMLAKVAVDATAYRGTAFTCSHCGRVYYDGVDHCTSDDCPGVEIVKKHIRDIRAGDVVRHDGKDRTVGIKDIKHCDFMGVSLFGDTYNLGHKLVDLVVIHRAIPVKGE